MVKRSGAIDHVHSKRESNQDVDINEHKKRHKRIHEHTVVQRPNDVLNPASSQTSHPKPFSATQHDTASLISVLRQALTSLDQKLLDDIIVTKDPMLIHSTIKQLPVDLIGTLIHQLVERVQRSPLRMNTIGVWIREILKQHFLFCSSIPSIRQDLLRIQEHALARLRFQELLVKMQGYTDTLVAICSRNLDIHEQSMETHCEKSPEDHPSLVYFKEESTSDELLSIKIPKHSESVMSDTESTLDPNDSEEPLTCPSSTHEHQSTSSDDDESSGLEYSWDQDDEG